MLFVAAVNTYFRQLAADEVLNPDFENLAEIDLERQRNALMAAGKLEAADWDDGKINLFILKGQFCLKTFNVCKLVSIDENFSKGSVYDFIYIWLSKHKGTMTLHKVDSGILNLIKDDIKAGKMPEIMIVGSVSDPSALGTERVQLPAASVFYIIRQFRQSIPCKDCFTKFFYLSQEKQQFAKALQVVE